MTDDTLPLYGALEGRTQAQLLTGLVGAVAALVAVPAGAVAVSAALIGHVASKPCHPRSGNGCLSADAAADFAARLSQVAGTAAVVLFLIAVVAVMAGRSRLLSTWSRRSISGAQQASTATDGGAADGGSGRIDLYL